MLLPSLPSPSAKFNKHHPEKASSRASVVLSHLAYRPRQSIARIQL
jgi:hypothetical protein